MNDAINILCSTDDNYVPYTGVMLTSMFMNNMDEFFEVYLLTRGLNAENESSLKNLEESFHARIHIIRVNQAMFEGCPIRPGDHVTLETYFRLLAPKLLPKHIDRILYMDGDVIVKNAVRPLWNWDVDQYAIAAVIDESYVEQGERLGFDSDSIYFNAGILLLNLKYWREHDVSHRCMKCIEDNPDLLLFHDQDTLNLVLKDEKTLLPITFNFQTGFYLVENESYFSESFKQQVLATAKNPTIIHYTGSFKPWRKSNNHPYRKLYLHYRKISFWRNFPLINDVSTITMIGLSFGRFARIIGLFPKSLFI